MADQVSKVSALSLLSKPQAPSVYCNLVQTVASNWDVRALFAEVVPGPNGEPVAEPRANIVMSWQHAKAFARVLLNNVEEYEKVHGEIVWQAPQAQGD